MTYLEGAGAALGRTLGDQEARHDLAGQGLLDRLAQARDAGGVAERPAFRVLHRKHVEREAVRGGEDLGVHDGAAGDGDGAGDLREQPRMIGGVDNDLADGAKIVAHGGQRQQLAAGVRRREHSSVAFMRFGVEG